MTASPPPLLLGAPFAGLRCSVATVRPCSRLGVAVWLRRPARTVEVRVDGRTVALATRPGRGRYRRWLFWQGIVHDRRAQRLADTGGRILLRVTVRTDAGRTRTTSTRVRVSEGYG